MIKQFTYNLTGTGWAEAVFTSNKQDTRFEVSYLSNPLADLFEGLCRLINSQSDTEIIVFAEEPGEHALVVSKLDKETIKVEIFWCDEWEAISTAYKVQSNKEVVYTDTDTLTNFAVVVCIGIDSLLERLTLKEYQEKWSLFEFPIDKYKQLRNLCMG